MNIERIKALVAKQLEKRFFTADDIAAAIRNALTEQAETHSIELRAYEATVANLEQRIRQLEAERVPDGWHDLMAEMVDDLERYVKREHDTGEFPTSKWEFDIFMQPVLNARAMLAAVQQQKEGE